MVRTHLKRPVWTPSTPTWALAGYRFAVGGCRRGGTLGDDVDDGPLGVVSIKFFVQASVTTRSRDETRG
ncbi:hypothetical protein IscW_ISCW023413 [Ixodes scapularis]|uniref:Uncharacterized protein n=1 Tax=Ixodes scapularis TaxID=6945 RepID=B7QL87_IXOSC|nr:hypothetical protein IscW_ISCW023413 [Ixodes scapularis]|eukprot:XP_002415942.1 hypothetical protein IscW_ISCW023413 [Ixodes scapularis]